MSVFQGRVWETNVYLSLLDVPVTTVTFGQVTVKYRKFGQTSLSIKTLTAGDWVNLGAGFYVLKWSATDTNTLGTFFYTLDGVVFDNFLYDEFVVDPVPVPLTIPVGKCVLSGNVVDIGGNAAHNHSVTVQPAELPLQIGSSLVAADIIRTIPDVLGNFSITLIQGQTVMIAIDRTRSKTQITIPNQSTANLTDLLPP